jgi:DNA polymerase-3 subunit delta
VVLRGLEKTGPDFRSRLAGHLKRPLKSTCVILESSDESVFAEFTGISGSPAVRRFGAITPREILSWIREAFAQRQKRIEEQGAILLMEMYGQNLTALDQEIGKICSYAGSRGVVRSVDVEDVAGKSLISSVFDLADAIGAGRSDTAMRICHDLVAEGKKEYEIIGLLCWHLKRLLKARSLQSRGLGDDRIASELRIAHRYRAGFFAQVSGLGMFRIRTGLKALLEADLDIKRTRFDPTLVLEFALIRICRRASS